MSIRLSCSRCQRAMQIDDRYAGRRVKCPGCATAITVPAPAPAPAPASDNPFGFAGPGGGSAGGSFDFDASSSPAAGTEGFQAPVGGEADGWRSTAGGLNLIWFGTGLQFMSVTVVLLVASIVFGAGSALLSTSRNSEPAPVSSGEAQAVSSVMVAVLVLGTLAIGTILRLVGFLRCLGTPSESGARGLAVATFLSELLVFLASAAHAGAVFMGLILVGLAADAASAIFWFIGLVLLLLFLRQIGVALDGKQLRERVVNFVFWLIGGVVGSGIVVGGYFALLLVLASIAASGQRSSGMGLLVIVATLVTIGVPVVVGLTLLVKYLGLFSTATDLIRRRLRK